MFQVPADNVIQVVDAIECQKIVKEFRDKVQTLKNHNRLMPVRLEDTAQKIILQVLK